METVKLYRLVGPEGDGIYRRGFDRLLGFVKAGEKIPAYHPLPEEDRIPLKVVEDQKTLYGFRDIEQLVGWFRYVNPLNVYVHGGKMLEITIPKNKVWFGRNQVAFDCQYPTKIRDVGVDEFVDLLDAGMGRYADQITW